MILTFGLIDKRPLAYRYDLYWPLKFILILILVSPRACA